MNDAERSFRIVFVIIIASTLLISASYRWRARRAAGAIPRAAERRSLIAGRIVIGLPLLLSLVAYMVSPAALAWSRLDLPAYVRWTAALLGFATIPLTYWVFRSLGSNVSETVLTKDQHVLVTSGPYHWVRHPLYSTSLLVFGLLGIVAASWLVLLLVIAAAVGIRLVAREEEQQLVARFPEYADYMKRTSRFVPRWLRSARR